MIDRTMRFWRRKKESTSTGRRRTLPFEDPRWDLLHPLAVLKVDGHTGRRTLLGYAENISKRGMMIGSVWPKEVHSRHQIEFALPAPIDLVVRCDCEVVWSRPYSVDSEKPGMGLEFQELSELAADGIEAVWRAGSPPNAPASRTWSDFDHAWIAWTPRMAARKSVSA